MERASHRIHPTCRYLLFSPIDGRRLGFEKQGKLPFPSFFSKMILQVYSLLFKKIILQTFTIIDNHPLHDNKRFFKPVRLYCKPFSHIRFFAWESTLTIAKVIPLTPHARNTKVITRTRLYQHPDHIQMYPNELAR